MKGGVRCNKCIPYYEDTKQFLKTFTEISSFGEQSVIALFLYNENMGKWEKDGLDTQGFY